MKVYPITVGSLVSQRNVLPDRKEVELVIRLETIQGSYPDPEETKDEPVINWWRYAIRTPYTVRVTSIPDEGPEVPRCQFPQWDSREVAAALRKLAQELEDATS